MFNLTRGTADEIASVVVGEFIKNKTPDQIINASIDEALAKVIPFTEALEDCVVTRFMSAMEEAVESVKKKGGLDMSTLWQTPTIDAVIDRE